MSVKPFSLTNMFCILQIHGSSCESMVNIDLEGASTSIEPSEFGLVSRGEHAAVEVIRFQPPPPSSSSSSSSPPRSTTTPAIVTSVADGAGDIVVAEDRRRTTSNSDDDTNNPHGKTPELQSLVPKHSVTSSSLSSSTSSLNKGMSSPSSQARAKCESGDSEEGERAALISKGDSLTLDNDV